MKYLFTALTTIFSICLILQPSYGMGDKTTETSSFSNKMKRETSIVQLQQSIPFDIAYPEGLALLIQNQNEEGGPTSNKTRKTTTTTFPEKPLELGDMLTLIPDLFPFITAHLGSLAIVPFDFTFPKGLTLMIRKHRMSDYTYNEPLNLRLVNRNFKFLADFSASKLDLAQKFYVRADIRQKLLEGYVFQERSYIVHPYDQTPLLLICNHLYNPTNRTLDSSKRTLKVPDGYTVGDDDLSVTRLVPYSEMDKEDPGFQLDSEPISHSFSGVDGLCVWDAPHLESNANNDKYFNPLGEIIADFLMDFTHFSNLKTLYISGNTAITTEHLCMLTNLTHLDLSDVRHISLKDLSPLSKLTDLGFDWKFPDIGDCISSFPNLQNLHCLQDVAGHRQSNSVMADLAKELLTFIEQNLDTEGNPVYSDLKKKCELKLLIPKAIGIGQFSGNSDPSVFDTNTRLLSWTDNRYLEDLGRMVPHYFDDNILPHELDIIETFFELIAFSGKTLNFFIQNREDLAGVDETIFDSSPMQYRIKDINSMQGKSVATQ